MHQRRYKTTVRFQFWDIVIQLLNWICSVKVLCDDVSRPCSSYGAHCCPYVWRPYSTYLVLHNIQWRIRRWKISSAVYDELPHPCMLENAKYFVRFQSPLLITISPTWSLPFHFLLIFIWLYVVTIVVNYFVVNLVFPLQLVPTPFLL